MLKLQERGVSGKDGRPSLWLENMREGKVTEQSGKDA